MWPLSLVSDIVKICVYLMLSKALKILKTKCPRSLLVSSDVRPNLCNLSSYDKLLSFVINRVALFCTFSNRSVSFFVYGRHACTQYLSFGLTKDWYSFNIILRVSVYKCYFDHTQCSISWLCCCDILIGLAFRFPVVGSVFGTITSGLR